MKPVRIGNQAREHLQHDVYGQIVLPLVQAFYDQRLLRPGTVEDFHALEKVGDRAFAMHDQVDAGLWEFRTIARVHTYSSVMCWAACDRLAKAADHMGLADRAAFWNDRATVIRERIEREALLVNPFSREELSDAIQRALTMPLAERKRKWERLMQVVRDTDVGVWRDDFVGTLQAIERPADGNGDAAPAHAA